MRVVCTDPSGANWQVYFNGDKVENVYELDTENGWIDIYDPNDLAWELSWVSRPRTTRKYGRVELVHRETGVVIRSPRS